MAHIVPMPVSSSFFQIPAKTVYVKASATLAEIKQYRKQKLEELIPRALEATEARFFGLIRVKTFKDREDVLRMAKFVDDLEHYRGIDQRVCEALITASKALLDGAKENEAPPTMMVSVSDFNVIS